MHHSRVFYECLLKNDEKKNQYSMLTCDVTNNLMMYMKECSNSNDENIFSNFLQYIDSNYHYLNDFKKGQLAHLEKISEEAKDLFNKIMCCIMDETKVFDKNEHLLVKYFLLFRQFLYVLSDFYLNNNMHHKLITQFNELAKKIVQQLKLQQQHDYQYDQYSFSYALRTIFRHIVVSKKEKTICEETFNQVVNEMAEFMNVTYFYLKNVNKQRDSIINDVINKMHYFKNIQTKNGEVTNNRYVALETFQDYEKGKKYWIHELDGKFTVAHFYSESDDDYLSTIVSRFSSIDVENINGRKMILLSEYEKPKNNEIKKVSKNKTLKDKVVKEKVAKEKVAKEKPIKEKVVKEKVEKSSEIKKKKSISKALRDKVWREYNGQNLDGKCYVCDDVLQYKNFEAGHVIAESKEGKTELSNLRPICSSCNRSCGDKNLDEFKKGFS
jgi:hypothetical protein